MNIRNIAELIILQCVEDLWNDRERSGSVDFFTGEGFSLCAGLAVMDLHDQGRFRESGQQNNDAKLQSRKKA